MVKLRISYENQQELKKVLEKLGNNIKCVKIPQKQEGKYKRAYVELEGVTKPE